MPSSTHVPDPSSRSDGDTSATVAPAAVTNVRTAAPSSGSATPRPAEVGPVKSRTARFISPELRAMARVVNDVDGRQFPELYAGPGRPAPPVRELERITRELHGGVPLTTAEFRLFRAAYAECRQHLSGISAEVLASNSRYSEILTLTTRIEAQCADANVALPRLFPNLKDVHELVLFLSDRGDRRPHQVHHELLDRLLLAVHRQLVRGLTALEAFQRVRQAEKRTAADERHLARHRALSPAVEADSTTRSVPRRPTSGAVAGTTAQGLDALSPLLTHSESPLTVPVVGAHHQHSHEAVETPGSPREISTLLSLVPVSDVSGSPRAPTVRVPGGHGSAASTSAQTSSPLDPLEALTRRAHHVPRQRSIHHVPAHNDDAQGDTDEEDSELDSLTLLPDEGTPQATDLDTDAAPGTPQANGRVSEDATSRQLRRAQRAQTKLEQHRQLQTRFLLCEDPSFLGPSSASHRITADDGSPSPSSPLGLMASPLAALSAAAAPDAFAGTGRGTRQGAADRQCMSRFMRRCAAHRAAETRSRFDSRTSGGVSAAVAGVALLATMPVELAREFCAVNALLRLHHTHLQWCAEAFHHEEALRFSVSECLADLSMEKAWVSCLGEGRAACTLEVFQSSGAIDAFPTWARDAVDLVVNYDHSGVISPFTLQRVLRVWGPLLLLDRNIASDLRSGVLELGETYEAVWPVFSRRAEAVAGDYVVCLTEEPGEVRLIVLRASRARHTSGAAGDALAPMEGDAEAMAAAAGRSRLPSSAALSMPFDISLSTRRFTLQRWRQHRGTLVSLGSTTGTGPGGSAGAAATLRDFVPRRELVTTSYRVSQETGPLSRESFETIADACAAFPTILRRAVGHVYMDDDQHAGNDSHGNKDPASGDPKVAMGDTTGPGARDAPAVPVAGSTTTAATYSALHRSCFRSNAAYVRTLMQRGAALIINSAVVDPSVSPDFCWTPLLCAVNNPNADPVEVVELLLQHGADVHYRDDAGCTALYYAIANGYTEATAALLRYCPTLGTSTSTSPILIAVGAHHYLPCERDIRRLAHVLPSRAMLEVVCRYAMNYTTVLLAAHILQDKLRGVDRQPRFWERHAVAMELKQNAGGITTASAPATGLGGVAEAIGAVRGRATDLTLTELRTPEQQQAVSEEIRHHTALCHRHRLELDAAVKVLYGHCYFLSWRNWLAELEASANAHRTDGEDTPSGEGLGLHSTVHSLAMTGRLPRSPLATHWHGSDDDDDDIDGGALTSEAADNNGTPTREHDAPAQPTEWSPTPEEERDQRRVKGGPEAVAVNSIGLLWYKPRELRRCLEHPLSVLPQPREGRHHVEVEDVELSKGGTATAALVGALADRRGGILRSRQLQQQEERLHQARMSVAEFGPPVQFFLEE